MSYNNVQNKGCTPLGCAGTLVVIALIIAFIFGNKELGSILIDIAIWVVITPVIIGLIYVILFNKK
ncbi:hypothetical protein ETU10_08725 [Apibacter muscae]|uniref:hypothetical protein n=1 Tax=Apibacter muscae TaxID=2509004 RepID=UPI0011AE066C|nr:hypothetical protein [Apibacter muscae]TWP23169.1 hypothetical protein ETU10_08725 [Apibacter muscae]